MDQENTTPSKKSSNSGPVVLVIAVVAILGILVMFFTRTGNNNGGVNQINTPPSDTTSIVPTDTPSPTVSDSPTPTVTPTVTPTGNTVQMTITGTEYSFSPSTLNVNKGDTVVVTFVNSGTLPHNFSIPDLNVSSQAIQPGEQTKVTFTPSQAGTFSFMCTIPGHADRGMVGSIIVK
jgi:nitrite reductase (NO-forming)